MATETWVINESFDETSLTGQEVSFTSNGTAFNEILVNTDLVYTIGGILPQAYIACTIRNNPFTGKEYVWNNEAYRTITLDEPATGDFLAWLEANAVKQASVYTLSYSTTHGTAPSPVSDITEITSSMLPELSASGYIFGGWYYESTYTTLAQAGDTLSADTTLYAKWIVDPDYLIKGSTLTVIGDAIRGKTGGTAELTPAEMAESITEELVKPSGTVTLTQQSGTDVSQYASASVRSGSLALNTPSVSSSGLITASASLSTSGWVGSAPTSKTYQMTTQAGKTVTPSTSQQTAVASGRYTTGAVYVAAVPTETKTATANGTVTPTSGKFLSSVTVAIPTYDGSVV